MKKILDLLKKHNDQIAQKGIDFMKKEIALITGVEPDAKMYVNDNGGIQSEIPYRCDLLPAKALEIINQYISLNNNTVSELLDVVIWNILKAQQIEFPKPFIIAAACTALNMLEVYINKNENDISKKNKLPPMAILECAKIMAKGAKSHGPEENWRLISANDHINHAQTHLWAYLAGDTQDDHLSHATVRLLMALETKLTPMGPYNPQIINLLNDI